MDGCDPTSKDYIFAVFAVKTLDPWSPTAHKHLVQIKQNHLKLKLLIIIKYSDLNSPRKRSQWKLLHGQDFRIVFNLMIVIQCLVYLNNKVARLS